MTENEQEAPPAPPRVPNVSPGAMSGLSHEVIGSAANEAHVAQHGEPDLDDQDESPPFDPTDSAEVHDWVLTTRLRVVEYAIEEVEALGDDADESLLADLRELLDGDDVPADDDEPDGTGGDEPPAIDPEAVAGLLAKNVDEVNDELDGATPEYVQAALAAESEGRARKGIMHGRHGTPEPA